MDIDSLYKKVKAENTELVNREKVLSKRLEEVKRLKKQNSNRKAKVKAMEAELEKLLSFED